MVGFQTSKELHSDDSMKGSDDSKEQSTQDFEEVNDTNDTNDTCCCQSSTILTMSVPKRWGKVEFWLRDSGDCCQRWIALKQVIQQWL